jgi:HK97 family phage portal protein
MLGLLARFMRYMAAESFALDPPRSGPILARTLPTWQTARPLEPKAPLGAYASQFYKLNTLIFSCVREIATSGAELRFCQYQRRPNGDDVEAMDSDLLQVLNRPNPEQSAGEFWTEFFTHIHVAGNGYIHKVRSVRGNVVQLWLFRPDRVRVKRAPDGRIEFYDYRVNPHSTVGEPIKPEDVIHQKWMTDPEDDSYGMSPITVLRSLGVLDTEAIDFLRAFFTNAGIPAGLLTFDHPVEDDERKRVKARWREEYTGLKRDQLTGATTGWHDVAVMDARVKYQQLAANIERLRLTPIFDTTESRVCAVYNVPPIVVGANVGLQRSTFANYGEARKSLWQETLIPLHKLTADLMTRGLAYEWGEDVYMKADHSDVPALHEDEDKVSTRVLAEWEAGVRTLNEARVEIGLDELDDERGGNMLKGEGEEPEPEPGVIPPALDPNADPDDDLPPADPTAKPPSAKPGAPVDPGKTVADPKAAQRRRARYARLRPARDVAARPETMPTWMTFARTADKLEARFARELASVFDVLGAAVADTVRTAPTPQAAMAALPDPQVVVAMLREVADEMLPRILQAGWERGKTQLVSAQSRARTLVHAGNGHAKKKPVYAGLDFNLQIPGVAQYLQDRPRIYGPIVADSVIDAMRGRLERGLELGEPIDAMARGIEDLLDDDGARARRIARTETIPALNKGATEVYKASGVVDQKEWLSAHDEKVRESHAAADGQRVPLTDNFQVGDDSLAFPGDPSGSPEEIINCRCTVVPVTGDLDEE